MPYMINSASPLPLLLLPPLLTLLQPRWPHPQKTPETQALPCLRNLHSCPLCQDHFVLAGPVFHQTYAWPLPVPSQHSVPCPLTSVERRGERVPARPEQCSEVCLHATPPSCDPGLTHPHVKTFFMPALCW